MPSVAEKTDPKLWEEVKHEVVESDKGGRPGQWSARKAQLATQEYKREGGGYKGGKDAGNHLHQWTQEEWGTKSGKKSLDTGERYLPKRARDHLSKAEYDRTTAKKRADTRQGKQFSKQPADVAEKASRDRATGHASPARPGKGSTKADLMRLARERNVRGRSTMTKEQLEAAVA